MEKIKADTNNLEEQKDKDALENDLKIVCIFGIKDPLKNGITAAVETLRKAGVTTRMVTGDNLQTAMAIAKEAGIIK